MPVSNHVERRSLTPDLIDSALLGVGHWSCQTVDHTYSGTTECCRLRELNAQGDSDRYDSASWWQCVHPADRLLVDSKVERLLSGDLRQISIHFRIQRKNQPDRWVLTRAVASHTKPDTKPVGIQGVDMDFTEFYQERLENERLRDELERLKITLDSTKQGLWQVDCRLGIRTENDTWRTMRGYAVDSAYSSANGWLEDIHPDDITLVRSHDPTILPRNEDTTDYAYRQRHADGAWQWIWSRGKIVERDSQGRPLLVIGADTDITQIKEDDTRFERLSKTLEIAIQAAGMGVWEWTLNARANVWNQRTREIFGIDIETEIVSHDYFMELVHPDDREDLNKKLRKTVQKLEDIDVDYRINHSQKGVRYLKAKAMCHVVIGEPTRYVGIVWDITDMIRADQERSSLSEKLSHGQRLKSIGELAGGIAHDFNNLLAVISGNAELLSSTIADGNKNLDAIVSASQRGAALTRGLLVFSRKQALQPASVSLGVVINNLRVMLDRTLSSTISISTRLSSNLWQCIADPVQVENALMNLIVNARDAMPNGGTIYIDTENESLGDDFVSLTDDVVPGEFVRVSVTDTGTGMSPDILNKSIDPFFTTKAGADGHGLGLSVVYGFIKQSNGHMKIDSVINKGTTVSLYLPRNKGNVPYTIDKQKAPGMLPLGHGEKILLVEDDVPVREMISTTLAYLGYESFCVRSGTEALSYIQKHQQTIDLVISDIVLAEDMNGFELGLQLAVDYPDIKVIYISGYAQDALNELGADNQNVEILEKPFSIEKLARYVAQKFE